MFKDFFAHKKKYAEITPRKKEIPEGIVIKCQQCNRILVAKDLEKNLKVCIDCGYHFRLNAYERVKITLDDGELMEYDKDMMSGNPLKFPNYEEKLLQQSNKTGLLDAVITGEGHIGGFPVIVAVMSFDHFTGSMGSVVGEKITRAIENAIKKRNPLIIFSTASGARMQEGIYSLMQMAKTSSALAKLNDNRILYISVLTDPTYGGVSASFSTLGDIIVAEPGAHLGFAGPRVIEQTIRQKLSDDFQTAEFNFKHGQVDKIVHRKDMRSFLIKILELHSE